MDYLQNILSAVISEKCFEEFFVKFNFSNVECLKQTISKGLGAGIILGSTLVKVPQIVKLHNAKSSIGMSFMSILLEIIGVTSAASYSYAKRYPFSSWGESLFLLIETAIIGFMVLMYSGQLRKAYSFLSLFAVASYLAFSGIVPVYVLWSMQMANVPIVIAGKMIQAISNYQNGHTGQLSPPTVFLLFLGSCARIFTSVQETGDPAIVVTFIAASIANGLLAGQIVYYWEATNKVLKAQAKKKE